MIKITVKPVNGEAFEVEGKTLRYENDIYYIAGQSFPEEIVTVEIEGANND